MAWFTLQVIALICVASAFGRMIFFTMAFAPTVFRKLERLQAARLMRKVLPNLAVLQGAGAVILFPANCYGIKVGTMAINCIVNFLLRQFLLPCMDRVRVSEPSTFSRLYQLSVFINIGLLATVPPVLAGRAE